MILTHFLILISVMFLTCVPGYLLVRLMPRPTSASGPMDAQEGAMMFGLGFMGIGFIQLVTAVAGYQSTHASLATYAILVIFLATLNRCLRRQWLRLDCTPLIAWIGLAVSLFLVSLATPSFRSGEMYDWQFYYTNTGFFTGQLPIGFFQQPVPLEYLAKRTPLFSAWCSFFMSFMGSSYDIMQVCGLASNTLLVMVALAVVRPWMNDRVQATLVLSIFALCPALTCALLTPEPKQASTGLLLLGWLLYQKIRRDPNPLQAALAAMCLVSAWLTHPSMLLYAGWIVPDQLWLWWRRGIRPSPVLLISGLGAILILAVPWFVFLALKLGPEAAFIPTSTVSQSLHLTPWQFLSTRLTMILATIFMPDALWQWTRDILAMNPLAWDAVRQSPHNYLNWVIRFYNETYMGGLTVCGFIILLSRMLRPSTWLETSHQWRVITGWFMGGALLSFMAILAMVDNKGQAANTTLPLFILVALFLAQIIQRLPRWGIRCVLGGMMAEWMFARWLVFRVTLQRPTDFPVIANTLQPVSNPVEILLLVMSLLIVAAAILLLQRAAVGTRNGAPKFITN